ncbi:acyltransferase family protein [Metabacillus idriensis]|uniref:acyltransferase family protein n=1 Tax=Metabacillus idriensis TaxID=324768 RepID=UPI00174E8A6B|nr:acyltransferase family protein [Metabacillus idriensis]
MSNKRISYIDSLKGIGIFLVIYAHSGVLPTYAVNYIYSFHMPLFFFISGFLFSRKKYANFNSFFKRKVNTILVPYFIFSILSYIFWVFIGSKFGGDSLLNISIFKPIIGILYSNGIDYWLIHNIPLWFLTCLFLVEIAYYYISRFKYKDILILLCILSVMGYVLSLYSVARLPWGFNVALNAIPFFGIGHLLRNKLNKDLIQSYSLNRWILMSVCLIINLFMVYLNGRVDMNENYYNNYFYFYIGAFTGITFWLMFAKLFDKSNLLKYLGKNSVILLCTHIIYLSISKGIILYLFEIEVNNITNSLLWGLIYTAISFILIIPTVYIINTYLPFIIGKSYKISKVEKTLKFN